MIVDESTAQARASVDRPNILVVNHLE